MAPLSHVYPEPRTPSPWMQGPFNSPDKTVPNETPSPGNWRHPQSQNIAKRQYAASFSSLNFHRALWNAIALLSSFAFLDEWIAKWFVSWLLFSISWKYSSYSVTFVGWQLDVHLFPTFVVWAFRIFFLYNIIIALYPLFTTTDSIEDIPLTDRQRALLGLNPSTTTTPLTPESNFVTPPKYRRSTGSPSQRTPSSTRSSPLNPSQNSGSPSSFMSANPRARGRSPFESSPLSQKGINRGGSQERASVLSSSLPGGRSISLGPQTPSPASRPRNGNINYKWLYEKGNRIPRSESGF